VLKSRHNADFLLFSGCLDNSHDRGTSAFFQCLARVMVMNLNFVKKILNTRKTANECRWSFVQSLKYQSTVDRFRKGEAEQKEFIEYALQENHVLKEQVESLEAENRYLSQMIERVSPSDFNTRTTLIFKGSEPELFPNEQVELVREIIEQKLKSGSCSIRVKNILVSILSANEESNNKDQFLGEVKTILAAPDGLSRQGKKKLLRLGFELTEDGKHYKIKIRGDDRYSHAISKSASDARAAKNNYSEFKERFFSV
ncbi:hypothetical protein ACFSO0_09600, partial [Brevibacillus sp. GCM10020057]